MFTPFRGSSQLRAEICFVSIGAAVEEIWLKQVLVAMQVKLELNLDTIVGLGQYRLSGRSLAYYRDLTPWVRLGWTPGRHVSRPMSSLDRMFGHVSGVLGGDAAKVAFRVSRRWTGAVDISVWTLVSFRSEQRFMRYGQYKLELRWQVLCRELKSIRIRFLIALDVTKVINLCRKGNWIR